MDPHVVIFPFLSQGHIMPLLDLSLLLSYQNFKVSLITTAANLDLFATHVARGINIDLLTLPFPVTEDLPPGCENTSRMPSIEYFCPFLLTTRKLRHPFQQLLRQLLQSANPPICVFSDFFDGWTKDVCDSLGLPRIVSHGMGVLSMTLGKYRASQIDSGLFPFELPFTDVEPCLNDPTESLLGLAKEAGIADEHSWGVVVNSFQELDGIYVPAFESFYKEGAKVWLLGPLLLHGEEISSNLPGWLDRWKDDTAKVIYVAFGSLSDFSDSQLDELAFGLHNSGVPFIWVIRSKTWSLPESLKKDCIGLIMDEWVDQRKILSHPSIGGFLTHAGWNSVLESVTTGVPMLTWPLAFDQPVNAKFVVDCLGCGLAIRKGPWEHGGHVEVWRDAIEEGVRDLINGGMGREARKRVKALGEIARKAVSDGGSSHSNLQEMISELRELQVCRNALSVHDAK